MRRERGTTWTERRKGEVRLALREGVDRDLICQRLGVTHRALTEAIRRFQLNRPASPLNLWDADDGPPAA